MTYATLLAFVISMYSSLPKGRLDKQDAILEYD